MIFLTVGMERFSFDRMVKVVDEAVGRGKISEVFMQTGHTKYQPVHCPFRRFLPFHEMCRYMESSDIIVSHAGIGSMLLSLHSGKVPILFPRRKIYNEHLHDHQMDISRQLCDSYHAVVVFEQDQLVSTILNYGQFVMGRSQRRESPERNRLVSFLNQSVKQGPGQFPVNAPLRLVAGAAASPKEEK